jgi:hypothetical protein
VASNHFKYLGGFSKMPRRGFLRPEPIRNPDQPRGAAHAQGVRIAGKAFYSTRRLHPAVIAAPSFSE